jgi:hypothetical protein
MERALILLDYKAVSYRHLSCGTTKLYLTGHLSCGTVKLCLTGHLSCGTIKLCLAGDLSYEAIILYLITMILPSGRRIILWSLLHNVISTTRYDKVKLSLRLTKHYVIEMYGRLDVLTHFSLTSTLVGREWSASCSGSFAPPVPIG